MEELIARLDPRKTAPFELGDGPDACLLIHGFTGSPWDMRPLGEALANAGFYVRAIRLPGHGTTPRAMAQVSHHDWEQACEEALLGLGPFRRVCVAGLSMGALLSMLLAARHPQRVRALALLAPAVNFLDRTLRLAHLMRRTPLMELLRPWIPKNATDIEDPRERADAPILPAFPSARLRDLWAVQEKARDVVPHVDAPALVAVARQDHVVSAEGGRQLARALKRGRLLELEQGFHILPRDYARERVAAEVISFFKSAAA